ncbi:hypothetical protein FGE12_12585 [Aggregicoccus sp. 17bor-14]|nr:hypothetical protein [Simulacricoccus sp. 17bor-14]MRI88985.1 hypothetical protein [Aggregicoccus sp. 17bor-14]
MPSATRPRTCKKGPVVRRAGSTPAGLEELSGLTASARHPGLFWSHNDSGHSLSLYALDAEGKVRARFPLYASAVDVEDVAVGPCEEGSCVWLADIGDNGARRPEVQLLRVAEPESLESQPLKVHVQRFAYEDGPQDAEALVVEPRSGRVFVLTKPLDALAHVYLVEGLDSQKLGRARRVATLPARVFSQRAATAASLSPDGTRLLVRGYFGAWEWSRPGATRLEEVLKAPPREVPGPSQPQAEAVAWLPDGSGYLLGSEDVGAPLYRVDCLHESRSTGAPP